MKLWKRIVLLALASLMILAAFAACTDEKENGTQENKTGEYQPLSPEEQQKLNEGVILEPGVETPVIFR